jgi:hypothetical protein
MPAGSTYTPIATTTLGSAQATVTFSSLGSYTDIVAVITAKVSASSYDLSFRVNGDSGTNYSLTALSGNGSTANSIRVSNATAGRGDYRAYMDTSEFNNYIINFMNYGNSTTYKTIIGRGNSAALGTDAVVNLWRNTAAITSIVFAPEFTGNFATGSTFTLYGIASA